MKKDNDGFSYIEDTDGFYDACRTMWFDIKFLRQKIKWLEENAGIHKDVLKCSECAYFKVGTESSDEAGFCKLFHTKMLHEHSCSEGKPAGMVVE